MGMSGFIIQDSILRFSPSHPSQLMTWSDMVEFFNRPRMSRWNQFEHDKLFAPSCVFFFVCVFWVRIVGVGLVTLPDSLEIVSNAVLEISLNHFCGPSSFKFQLPTIYTSGQCMYLYIYIL